MSTAEIADNRWEVEATKVEATNPAGLMQLVLVAVFGVFFVGVALVALYSLVAGPQESEMEQMFKKQAPAAAPAQ